MQSLAVGNVKSGRPGKFKCRRQPRTFAARSAAASRTSVVAFPKLRMAAIRSDRCVASRKSLMLLFYKRLQFNNFDLAPSAKSAHLVEWRFLGTGQVHDRDMAAGSLDALLHHVLSMFLRGVAD